MAWALALAIPLGLLLSPIYLVLTIATIGFLSRRKMLAQLKKAAERRTRLIRGRLAVAVDLLALILQAGASVPEGLAIVVREMDGHPLADEFAAVLRDVRRGIPRTDAFNALASRFDLDVLTDFVATVIQGEARGTPLVDILKSQAEQMRLRHSQWLEKAAARAAVAMHRPNMIAMIASILILLAPFALSAWEIVAPMIRNGSGAF
jgi:tight adherence protein C